MTIEHLTEEMELDTYFKILRLITGDDIICVLPTGGFPSENTSSFMISNPLQINFRHNRTGSPMVILSPWISPAMVISDTCNIPSNMVITIFSPSNTFIDYYIKMKEQIDQAIESVSDNIEDDLSMEHIDPELYSKGNSTIH